VRHAAGIGRGAIRREPARGQRGRQAKVPNRVGGLLRREGRDVVVRLGPGHLRAGLSLEERERRLAPRDNPRSATVEEGTPGMGRRQRDDMSSSLLTAGQVAQLLGVPVSWVYEQSRRGRIPTVNLGRYRRYRRDAIEAWIAEIEAPARGVRAYARSV
jgi:excisionase family DNA binding protein